LTSVRLGLRAIYARLVSPKWRRTQVEGVHVPLKLRIRRFLTARQLCTEDELLDELKDENAVTVLDAIRRMKLRREVAEVQRDGEVFLYPLKTERLLGRKEVARVGLLGSVVGFLALAFDLQNGLALVTSIAFLIAVVGYLIQEDMES